MGEVAIGKHRGVKAPARRATRSATDTIMLVERCKWMVGHTREQQQLLPITTVTEVSAVVKVMVQAKGNEFEPQDGFRDERRNVGKDRFERGEMGGGGGGD